MRRSYVKVFTQSWGRAGLKWASVEALEVGQDVTPLSPSPLQAKERQREREHFPEERRAERLDNSRCFPGAYRGRGPSGFVSCGCSCLRAKWTTVDLTLDPSSPSLCLLLVLLSSRSFSTLTVCLSPSFLSPSHSCGLLFSHDLPGGCGLWVRWPKKCKVFPQFYPLLAFCWNKNQVKDNSL